MAQKLKFGNGTWATKEGSTLAYNDENNNYKPLPFSFTRDSIATRVNKEGLIEVVGKDKPRIDYTDSADGVLLLENSSTNLITQSQAFDDSYWTKSGSSVTSNNAISPDGSLNASKLVEGTNNGGHFIKKRFDGSSSKYTNSIFVKAGEVTKVGFAESGSTDDYASFDLESGSLISSGGNSSFSIKKISNNWFKISLTSDSNLTRNDFNISLLQDNYTSGVPYAQSYQGDGTSGIYIWGAQLEQQSYATSYIPTSGSTVQRAAETANGAGNSEVFNDSEGVLYINTAALANDGTNRQISISDGNTNQRVYFGFRTNVNEFLLSSRDSSYIVTTIGDATNYNKYVFQYKSGNFKAFVNGFNYVLDADGGLLPTGLNTLNFDNGAGADDFYGKTKEISYYDTALTDEELETLTSYRSLNELVTELNLNKL